jgi:hypothetical protein
VVCAEIAADPRGLRLFSCRFSGSVFGLANVHDRAKLLALLGGSGVDRDDRDALGAHKLNRTLQKIEVGYRNNNAVVIARGGLFDQPRHVGKVAAGRIAIVDLNIEILRRIRQAILHGVPPKVGIGSVTNEDESLIRGARVARK